MSPHRWSRGFRPCARPARVAVSFRPRLQALEPRLSPAVLTVNSLADTDVRATALSLRAAILAVDGLLGAFTPAEQAQVTGTLGSNDTIRFSVTGTINLTSTLMLTRSAGIVGPTASAADLVLRGQGTAGNFGDLNIGSGITANLSGITIANGGLATPSDGPGGGILNSGNLTLANCVVTGNSAAIGGGIYNASGSLTITNSTFTGNLAGPNQTPDISTAVWTGGAIFGGGNSGLVTLTNDTFSGNQASKVGGVYLLGGNGVVQGCLFTNNLGTADCGAYFAVIGTNSTISNSSFLNNDGGLGDGGAIHCSGHVDLNNCTLIGNRADLLGGGLVSHGAGGTATNCTFSDNFASYGGAAHIINFYTFVNCTITRNHVPSDGSGGGVEYTTDSTMQDGMVFFTSSIVAGNFRDGPTPTPDDLLLLAQFAPNSANNLIGVGTNTPGAQDGVNGNQVGTQDHPLDPKLGPLALNGGPTLTRALLPGSPAINAGGPSSAGPATDQRGFARTGKANDDIGAVGFGLGAGQHVYAVATQAGTEGTVKVYNANGNLRFTLDPYPGFRGGVQVAVGDVLGTGHDEVVTIPGRGGAPQVNVYDGLTGRLLASFDAYDPGFVGGVDLALGDTTGQGYANLITVPGRGGSPEVRVFHFSGTGPVGVTMLAIFNAYDPRFTGGIRVAAADTQGLGYADIITVPQRGGSPEVRVFDGRKTPLAGAGLGVPTLGDFNAYDPRFTGGITVGAGDTTGNGYANIVTTPGAGGSPEVHVYDGRSDGLLKAFNAYETSFTGGITVVTADVFGIGYSDLVISPGAGRAPEVRVFDGKNPSIGPTGLGTPNFAYPAYPSDYTVGFTLIARDVADLGYAQIVTVRNPGSFANVRLYDPVRQLFLADYIAFDPTFLGGAYLA